MTIRRRAKASRSTPSTTSAAIAAIRRALARQYDVGCSDPDIQIVDVDLAGDRRLILRHRVLNGVLLDEADAKRVLQHLADLWGYDVSLAEVDPTGTVLKEYVVNPRELAAAAA